MNNRSAGRRRGRSSRAPNRGPNDGNRQNSRNPGNAHQLCEKYKSMARDAHQQGDRVMNEYYLQFADHYFRILAEVNSRKDDQQRDRDEPRKSGSTDDRENAGDRNNSNERHNSNDRDNSSDRDDESQDQIKAEAKSDNEDKPKRRTRKPAKDVSADASKGNGNDQGNGAERIEADRLPGSIGLSSADDGDDDDGASAKPARKPTRARAPKTDADKGPSAEA